MTNIKLPFNEWSIERLEKNMKTATTRRKRYGKPGDHFIAAGKKWMLTEVRRIRLGEVAEKYYRQEGAESPEEFIEVWKKIHPRAGWTPEKRVWIHFFEPVNC